MVDTFLGSLVQSCYGGGGTLQTNITGVCGECSQCLGHTGFAPAHGVCACPVFTAQALGCSAKNCLRPALGCIHVPDLSCSGSCTQVVLRGADSVGPAFVPFPGPSSSGSEMFGECSCCHLSPPPSLPLGFLSVQPAHLLRRVLAVQNPKKSWLATKSACSLVDNASLGPQLSPSDSGCPCLPVSGVGWAGLWPAISAQSFVL